MGSCLDSTPVDRDVYFEAKPFLDYMQSFNRQLRGEKQKCDEEPFQLPAHLKDFVYTFLFYELAKKDDMHFKNLPPTFQYVDMLRNPEKEIAFIHRLIHDTTNGFFKKLDPATECDLRHGDFRYLLLGIFYIKAKWEGHLVGEHAFRNKNGEHKEAVFFKFEEKRCWHYDKRIHVRVHYLLENGSFQPGSYVIFSKPCSSWPEKYKFANIFLPRLELEAREEMIPDDHLGKIVLNFKYVQDENGFEAGCLYGDDAIDGECPATKDVWFDEPFRIEIFHRDVRVFRVDVFNL